MTEPGPADAPSLEGPAAEAVGGAAALSSTQLSTLRHAFWDALDAEVPPPEPPPPQEPAPAVQSASASASPVLSRRLTHSARLGRAGRARSQAPPVASSAPSAPGTLERKSTAEAVAPASGQLARKKKPWSLSKQGEVRRASRSPSKGEAFPNLPLKRVLVCRVCGRGADEQSFLRCAVCKVDTCNRCTTLRRGVSGPALRLTCDPCAAHEAKEAVLRRVASAPAAAVPNTQSEHDLLGMPLERLWAAQPPEPGASVPRIMGWLLQRVVELGGPRSEGLYRLSVAASMLRALRDDLNAAGAHGAYVYPQPGAKPDVNVVAALFKAWLRDLPEPLCSDYAGAVVVDTPAAALAYVAGLRPAHRAVFRALLEHLRSLAQPAVVTRTRMDVNNFSMVFSQCVLRNPSLNPHDMLKGQPLEHRFMLNAFAALDGPAADVDAAFGCPRPSEGVVAPEPPPADAPASSAPPAADTEPLSDSGGSSDHDEAEPAAPTAPTDGDAGRARDLDVIQ